MSKVPKMGIIALAILIYFNGSIAADEFFGIEIHGFASQGYLRTTEYDNYLSQNSHTGSWEYNEIGINFQKDLLDNLRIGIQLFARDLGVQGNNDVVIDWALFDYRFKDWLGLRVGRIKTPMGFYNQGRDIDMLRTQIILPQGLYNETTREVLAANQGFSVYGNYDFGKAGNIEYEVYLGSVSIDNNAPFLQKPYVDAMLESAASAEAEFSQVAPGTTAVSEPISIAFDMKYLFGGMLIYNTPIEGLRAGFTYLEFKGNFTGSFNINVSFPNPADPTGSTTIASIINVKADSVVRWRQWIAGLDYQYKNFGITAEYYQRLWLVDDNPGTYDYIEGGFHILAKYRFCNLFELGTYYEMYWPNIDDKNGDDLKAAGSKDYEAYRQDICFTGRFDFNEYWIFKAEVHFMNGIGSNLSDVKPIDANSGADWILFALKTTISF